MPRITLSYPDEYGLGMSCFSLAVVRDLLVRTGKFDVRRAFAPAPDLDSIITDKKLYWVDIEAGEPVSESRVIGFTVSSELLFSNILHLLDLAGLKWKREQRHENDPLIIAGGGGITNPVPLSGFIDLFFLGEVEEQIEELFQILTGTGTKKRRLETAAKLPGVYVPAFGPSLITVQRFSGFHTGNAPVIPIVPIAAISHDRAVVEIARGCSRGCRFCQASQLARPVRERSPDKIQDILEQCLAHTGWESAGLLTLSFSDYSRLEELLYNIDSFEKKHSIRISRPSLRPDSFLRFSKETRFHGRLTMAPEAGSEELRERINKPLSDAAILEAVERAFSMGATGLKLYFMVGLPYETDADLEAIGLLAGKIAMIARKAGRNPGKAISISLSSFIPKPHTPLQWSAQLPPGELCRRIELVRKLCHNVHVSWNDPRLSVIEAVLGHGDEVTGDILEKAVTRGARFDAWTDRLQWDIWNELFEEYPYQLKGLQTEKDPHESLPWDFITTGVSRKYLVDEYRNYRLGKTTSDCRLNGCTHCGACDGTKKDIRKTDKIFKSGMQEMREPEENFSTLRVKYCKTELGRFTSHLDMVRFWMRAIRRASIPVLYSRGHIPRPKIHFGPALPLGFESEAEYFDILLSVPPDPQLPKKLEQVVSGKFFKIIDARFVPLETTSPDRRACAAAYSIKGLTGTEADKIMKKLSDTDGVIAVEKQKKDNIHMTIHLGRRDLRPDRIIERILDHPGYFSNNCCFIRRVELFFSDHGNRLLPLLEEGDVLS